MTEVPGRPRDPSSSQAMLQPDPTLAEAADVSHEQLDALARSVERRRQQLDGDIKAYIKTKQAELRSYEQELLLRHRSMDHDVALLSASSRLVEPADVVSAVSGPSGRASEERLKQKKHTRVHKREKELCGLVTPVFLPLLDAVDMPPALKKDKKPTRRDRAADARGMPSADQAVTPRDAEKTKEGRRPRKDDRVMDDRTSAEPAKELQHADCVKKSKRSAVKKSSLRHNNTPRTRRKRVSLVIDGQTVLPADTIVEPPLTSPSSETTSPSNSTASLDDMIDPRLTSHGDTLPHGHHDAVHHSLPIPLSNNVLSPTKPLVGTPSSMSLQLSPTLLTSPGMPFSPLQATPHSLLASSAAHAVQTSEPAELHQEYPNQSPNFDDNDLAEEQIWDTYVGGMDGSGVDDFDQAGSYGYPSSLGASYLESYMQSRPLSVRMHAAGKMGLRSSEQRRMVMEEREDMDDAEDTGSRADMDIGRGGDVGDDDDDMDIVGSMEDF